MPTKDEIKAGAVALATEQARIYSLGLTPAHWGQHNFEAYLVSSKLVLEAVEAERQSVRDFLEAE